MPPLLEILWHSHLAFWGESTFKKVLAVMMIKRTHFLRHLALARLVGDIVEH